MNTSKAPTQQGRPRPASQVRAPVRSVCAGASPSHALSAAASCCRAWPGCTITKALAALVPLALFTAGTPAQVPIDSQTLAELRSRSADSMRPDGALPLPGPVPLYGTVRPSGAARPAGRPEAAFGAVDLYRGLLPSGNGFWYWSFGGSEAVYWALDDGTMGPGAAAVGGGEVTEYEFSYGLHADVPDDTLRPFVVVSFYNAPYDPVAQATDPVVEPPTPVSSLGWIFDPITLPQAGFYAVRTGMIDLVAAGVEFDLDENFYVEILPLEWSSYPDGAPVADPDVFAVFTGPGTVTCGTNQDHMWSLLWVLQGGCDPVTNLVYGDNDSEYDHPEEMYDGGCDPFLNQSGIILRGLPCDLPVLELSNDPPEELCVGDTVTVTLSMSCIPGLVRGFQAFLEFDPGALEFLGGTYTDEPFGLPIIDPIVADGGNIDLAAGIDDLNGQQPTSTSADLAVLTFRALVSGTSQVRFRAHDPPTRLSDDVGEPLVPTVIDSPIVAVDVSPPEITCPADIETSADAGVCHVLLDPGLATATDNCDDDPTITWLRSDGKTSLTDPYEAADSPITITWRATDDSGNYAECVQTITVHAVNELVVDVELSPTVEAGPFTRCITFELWDCPGTSPAETIEQVLTFSNGVATTTLEVPCGAYECLTARDTLHTLRRTATLGTTGSEPVQYTATFTGNPDTGGDWLIGGNLNDDRWIDILDFGVFSAEWGENYGSGSTDCNTPAPHADLTGDGTVWIEDFTYIQVNFLRGHEANCCGQPGFGQQPGPITRISVEELRALGLGELAAGDLNQDGWLDEADIAAFLNGARPRSRPTPTPPNEKVRRGSLTPAGGARP